MMLVSVKDIRNDRLWIGNQPAEHSLFLASISSPLKEASHSYKTIADINGYLEKGKFYASKGKVLIYFSKNSCASIKAGDKILFYQSLSKITNSGNPESFDYQEYCLLRGITHKVYLSQQNFKLYPDPKTTFLSIANNVTDKILKIFRKYIPNKKETGLAEAMLVGYKDDLDKSLLESYTNVGVVHIVAISGMHLILIYALLIAITFPSNAIKKFIWWRAVIILVGIWFFTLLTGYQASILRAAIMLTCFVFSKTIFRKTSSLNSLAFSAFILLCWNPFWLWDIGFQLSYLAVASIFIFYKPILHIIHFQNKLMISIWKAIALTLSAQILTTPITIYYFHQFPRLFLISNLIAVPLSSLILLLEIILLSVSWIPLLAGITGKLIYVVIFCLDEFILRIQKVPESIWKGLYISIFQCVMLYLLIFSLATYIKNKNPLSKYISTICIICFCTTRISSFINSSGQHKLIVYNIPGRQAVQLVNRRDNWIITKGLTSENYLQSIQPSLIKWRLNSPTISFINQFDFGNRKIVILDTSISINPLIEKQQIDYLILSKKVSGNLKEFVQNFSIHQIILDSSIPEWKAQLLKNQCDSLNVPCFDVRKEGAFVRNL